ncbi:hypothetical protein BC826DRAFT_352876 [Russula brevipes]|nr:hypothetical protein BC826DRAFT_352876 [Russula brevipes]
MFCTDRHHVRELGYHVHLCTLSAGDKHPLSQTDGIIRLSLNREFQWWSSYWYDFSRSSRIRGDYLVFFVDSRRSWVLSNWRSGALLDMPLPLPCIAFSFLGDRRIVLVFGTYTTAGWGSVGLHVYSLQTSVQNSGDVLTPCLEAIYMLPDDKILGYSDHAEEVRLCSSFCRSIPAGHFYRDTADTETALVLSTTIPETRRRQHRAQAPQARGSSRPTRADPLPPRIFNLIIPVSALQTPARHGGGHRPASESSAGNNTPDSVPKVPWSEWGRATISDPFPFSEPQAPHQWYLSALYRLPFASGARTVMHELLARQNQGAASTSSGSPAMDTVDQLNALVVTDYHPRRVAFAVARRDPRIRHSQPLSVGADAPHAHLYLRVQATLPTQLQRLHPSLLCPAMCGDAVILFQYTRDNHHTRLLEKLHVFTF